MANIWNAISRQPSHSRKKEKELVVPGGSIKWSKSKNQNITAPLRTEDIKLKAVKHYLYKGYKGNRETKREGRGYLQS